MKTSELTGNALSWAVAKIELQAHDDETNLLMVTCGDDNGWKFKPSTDWAQGGSIIEREKITWDGMAARIFIPERNCSICVYGPTILIAAMRCFVSSKLGDEIDIPKEFI